MGKVFGGLIAIIAGLVVLTILGGSWYTVDQGERGVVLRNGRIVGVADPGFHGKMPWIEDVEHVSTRSNSRIWERMESYSSDQQPAHFKVSVNYHIPADKVADVYSQYGNEANLMERTLDRHVPQQMKVVFGNFTAATSIQDRQRLNNEFLKALTDAVNQAPLVIESVQVEDIKFSDDYEEAVRQRMQAEVEVQKIRQNAEREKVTAQITVIQAQARADSQLAEATANAKAIELKGNAEAEAIKARGDALAKNPGLVLLTQAERWNGVLPSTMLPSGGVPFLNLGPQPQLPQAAAQAQ